MKLHTRLVSTMLLLVSLAILVLQVVSFYSVQETGYRHIVDHLSSISQLTENYVDQYLADQVDQVKIAATHQELTDDELRGLVYLVASFDYVFVLDPRGIVNHSSNLSIVGRDMSSERFFIGGKERASIYPAYHSGMFSDHYLPVSAPFHGGVLVAFVGLSHLNEIVADETGLGATGESLMAYRGAAGDAVFFTQRRFSDVIGESIPSGNLDRPIVQALLKNESIFFGSPDYRGHNVIAVTKYIGSVDFGLVTKIDESEAYTAVSHLRWLMLFMVLVSLSLMGVVVYIVSDSISVWIVRLSRTIDEVSRGRFDVKIPRLSNIDEIDSLIESFSRILATMKVAVMNVQKGIADQGILQQGGRMVPSQAEGDGSGLGSTNLKKQSASRKIRSSKRSSPKKRRTKR